LALSLPEARKLPGHADPHGSFTKNYTHASFTRAKTNLSVGFDCQSKL